MTMAGIMVLAAAIALFLVLVIAGAFRGAPGTAVKAAPGQCCDECLRRMRHEHPLWVLDDGRQVCHRCVVETGRKNNPNPKGDGQTCP